MNKDFHIEGIGTVKMSKGNRFSNLKISIRPFNRIEVTVPSSVSFIQAEKFVIQKKEWIKHSIEKFKKIESRQTLFDADSEFKTRDHSLKLLTHSANTIKIIIKNNFIYFFYPAYADIKDMRVQNAIRKAILEAWRIEAWRYLPQRVEELAKKYGFSYRKLTFKNAGTRWGSCSTVDNINLNVQLMRLPQRLCDYIILHELAHTVEKNHGRGFWGLLEKITGNAKALDKEMKNYNLKVW